MTHPILAEIEEWDRNRPRCQQVELGASDAYGCRAAAVLHLNGVPGTDSRLRWDALVGTALHLVAQLAAPADVIAEGRFTYRGVTASVDRYDPKTRTLTDLKSKDTAAKVRSVARFGPNQSHVAQVHLGAAALQEAGHVVERVELLYVPRVGDPNAAYLWGEEPDRSIADEAVDWIEGANREAAARAGLPVSEQVWGLQDSSETFCRRYCAYVTACRGPVESVVSEAVALEDVL